MIDLDPSLANLFPDADLVSILDDAQLGIKEEGTNDLEFEPIETFANLC